MIGYRILSFLMTFIVMMSMLNNAGAQTFSADRKGLENGEGMGMAKYAELNGYPGPKHVLELSNELGLTEEQKVATENIFDTMKSEAVKKGKEIISLEGELHELFISGKAAKEAVRKMGAEIGRLRGELRAVHLTAHLRRMNVLSQDQIQRYMQLRGHGLKKHKHGH